MSAPKPQPSTFTPGFNNHIANVNKSLNIHPSSDLLASFNKKTEEQLTADLKDKIFPTFINEFKNPKSKMNKEAAWKAVYELLNFVAQFDDKLKKEVVEEINQKTWVSSKEKAALKMLSRPGFATLCAKQMLDSHNAKLNDFYNESLDKQVSIGTDVGRQSNYNPWSLLGSLLASIPIDIAKMLCLEAGFELPKQASGHSAEDELIPKPNGKGFTLQGKKKLR